MENFEEIAASFGVPEPLRPALAPDAPSRGKVPIARAVLPAPPKIQIAMAYLLLGDPDPEIAETARRTLCEMPPRVVVDAISGESHPKVLEFFAYHQRDAKVLEKVALQHQANDRTLCYLAETAPERVVDIVASNQERLLIAPQIYLHLRANPATPRATLYRVATFQRMCGIDLAELEARYATPSPPPTPPAEERPAVEPAAPAAASAGIVPDLDPNDPLSALLEEFGMGRAEPSAPAAEPSPPAAPAAPRPAIAVDSAALSNLSLLAQTEFDFGYGDDDEAWDQDLIADHGERPDDDVIQSIATKIAQLTTGQKIKLAYVGNKEVRELLVRDRNKMVASAVVKSGRMTEPEVVRVVQNRSIHDEVLRMVASNREWLRRYPVKVALVGNPKCPLPVAVGIISSLQVRDLKLLANNRNVSSVVFSAAGKMLKERKQT